MDLTYIYTCSGLPFVRSRPADASHSEWTAYHDDLTDLWQILPGPPVLQPGLPSGLQMSNPL